MIITYEEIARRAFEIYERTGQIPGKEQEHWLQAEAELRQESMKEHTGSKVTSKDPSMLKTPRMAKRAA